VQNLKSTFDKDGYVAIQSFLDIDEVDELRQETLRFIDEEVPGLPVDVVYCEIKDDYSTLKQIQKLNEYSNYFESLAKSDPATSGWLLFHDQAASGSHDVVVVG